MADQDTGRQPEQQSNPASQQQPRQQQHQKHPRGESGGNLASQTPKGGTAQDGFGQSGTQGTPDPTEHNARPGEDI